MLGTRHQLARQTDSYLNCSCARVVCECARVSVNAEPSVIHLRPKLRAATAATTTSPLGPMLTMIMKIANLIYFIYIFSMDLF